MHTVLLQRGSAALLVPAQTVRGSRQRLQAPLVDAALAGAQLLPVVVVADAQVVAAGVDGVMGMVVGAQLRDLAVGADGLQRE